MNQTSKKLDFNLKPGSVINGKWHKNQYVIKKALGRGAIGSVFLVENNGKLAALKISSKGSSITMEVNVLKTLQKVQGSHLGPSLLDVDDWVDARGNRYSFYVMDYLRGTELSTFINSKGEEWLGILIMQLLDDLNKLHEAGWVFGDLKSDNLIVTYPPPRLRWIDVGGTTQIGRSIKEYTEFYDRGYWNMGSRKAEPSYDLFALAMVMIHYYHPKHFDKGTNPERTLLRKLAYTRELQPYQLCLKKALTGQYSSGHEMKRDINHVIMNHSANSWKQQKQPSKRTKVVSQSNANKKSAGSPFLEGIAISIIVILFYMLYLFLV